MIKNIFFRLNYIEKIKFPFSSTELIQVQNYLINLYLYLQTVSGIKLVELNSRYNFLRPGFRVLDLGCSPGCWSASTAKLIGSNNSCPTVFGVDLIRCQPIDGVTQIVGDIENIQTKQDVWNALKMKQVDIILSDVWPIQQNDNYSTEMKCLAQMDINFKALQFSLSMLKPGGILLMRMLKGDFEIELQKYIGALFQNLELVNTMEKNNESSNEFFYLGQGFTLTKTYQNHQSFFKKQFSDQMDQITENEIPQELMSKTGMKDEIIKFLWLAHEKKFQIERSLIEEIQALKEFKNFDFTQFQLNIYEGELSEKAIEEIFTENAKDKVKHNYHNINSYEQLKQLDQKYQQNFDDLIKFQQKQKRKSDSLLDEQEILGQKYQMPQHLKNLEKHLNSLKPSEFEKRLKAENINTEDQISLQKEFGKLYYQNEFKNFETEELKKKLFEGGTDISQFTQENFDDIVDDLQNSKAFQYSHKIQEQLYQKSQNRVDKTKKHRK